MTLTTVKNFAKRIPLVPQVYSLWRKALPRKVSAFAYEREDWSKYTNEAAIRRSRILNILNYTKTSGTDYSGKEFPAGYHQIEINNEIIAGRRNPRGRLQHIPIDFQGLTILDIGCNQGGMVFELQNKVKWAIGIDFDYKMINSCNLISKEKHVDNSSFYVFDIDKDPHDLIRDFLPEKQVDVVFLLAVCLWVEKWREIIKFSATISSTIVFEANGTSEKQEEQIEFLRQQYRDVIVLSKTSDDDPKQKGRQLLIARNNHHPIMAT